MNVLPPDLERLFDQLNQKYFASELDLPKLYWNTRMRASAGRFHPGRRILGKPPVIEIAHYLLKENDSMTHIQNTLGHEMIHYWLWVRKRPHGHTPEFYKKMKEMGVPRFNPVPKRSPPKYLYQCPGCLKEYPAKRRWRELACASCCRDHAGGKFDKRFKLVSKCFPTG